MKITNLALILIVALFSFACDEKKPSDNEEQHAHEPAESETTAKKVSKSPATEVMANIGTTHVHIAYHAPSARGRTIFGGLVAYDEIWVTGAHSATSIEFYNDVTLNEQKVPKGKYALFTIPGETSWKIIINKNFEQHLADDYDASLDVIRIEVAPEELSELQEQLLYEIISRDDQTGIIRISWDKTLVQFEVKILE